LLVVLHERAAERIMRIAHDAIAHATRPHSPAITTAAPASRCAADIRTRDAVGDAARAWWT
jgi:hypothetical protein